MDETDSKILALLSKNSRQPNSAIAGVLGISEGTVRSRIKNLVEEKRIRRFTIDSGAYGFRAVVLLKTDPSKHTEDVLRSLVLMDGVRTAYEVSGEWDAVLIAYCKDAEAFNELVEAIRTKKGVIETESLVVLKAH
jgi:DNA-binding Lrp family transcriptional regulator